MLFRIISCPSCGYESNGQGRSCNKCGAPLIQHDLVTNIQPKLQPLSPHNLGSGDTSKNLLEHAKKLLSEGKVRESEIIFKQVIASGQNTSEGFYGLGFVRLDQGDLDGAATQFKNALQEDPKNANALYQLGWIAEKQQSWEAASTFYGKALSIHPQHKGAIAALKRHPDHAAPYTGHEAPHFVGKATLLAPHGVVPLTTGGTFQTKDGAELSKYGVYGILLQDSSPTSRYIIALIDDLRMIRIHPTFTAFLGSFLVRLFFALIFGIGASYMSSLIASSNLDNPSSAFQLSVLPLIVASILCLISIIMKCFYIYSITITIDKGRLQVKKGIFGDFWLNEELLRVHDIEVRRTLLNRLTGDGTLIFTFEHKPRKLKVRGLVKGARLDEIREQLLNLVGLLRANQALKGIIQ